LIYYPRFVSFNVNNDSIRFKQLLVVLADDGSKEEISQNCSEKDFTFDDFNKPAVDNLELMGLTIVGAVHLSSFGRSCAVIKHTIAMFFSISITNAQKSYKQLKRAHDLLNSSAITVGKGPKRAKVVDDDAGAEDEGRRSDTVGHGL